MHRYTHTHTDMRYAYTHMHTRHLSEAATVTFWLSLFESLFQAWSSHLHGPFCFVPANLLNLSPVLLKPTGLTVSRFLPDRPRTCLCARIVVAPRVQVATQCRPIVLRFPPRHLRRGFSGFLRVCSLPSSRLSSSSVCRLSTASAAALFFSVEASDRLTHVIVLQSSMLSTVLPYRIIVKRREFFFILSDSGRG